MCIMITCTLTQVNMCQCLWRPRAQLSGVRSLLHSGARELKFEDSRISAFNSQHIILKKKKKSMYLLCVYVFLYLCTYTTGYVCSPEDNLWELVIFLRHVSLRWSSGCRAWGQASLPTESPC